jgi:hypothetical protein
MAHGGTFVRPGAFAWGPPGALDSAADRADSAVVDDALAVAVKDHDRVNDLLDELRRGRLWLPLPDGDGPVTDGSAVHLPTVTYLGAEFVPAFTSAARLAAWPAGGPAPALAQPNVVPHIVVPAGELARRLPPGLGIALNPGAEASVPIYPDGVSYLAASVSASSVSASSVSASSVSASSVSGQVLVGHPPADPVDLLGVVRDSLRSVAAVRQASRAWLSVPGHGEGLVISVALRDPASHAAHHAVIEAIERAAAAVPHQFPIDVTFPGEGEPDQVDEWIAATAEPFYIQG